MSAEHPSSLDILIPTRDRPLRLVACLASLSAQDLSIIPGPINLYLLDNGRVSAFADGEVARQLDALAFRGLRTFYLRRPHLEGIFWIRRELYEISSGDVVCYLDDDVVLDAGSISHLWDGVVNLGFNLATALIIDVDGLHPDTITQAGHCIAQTIERLVQRLEEGQMQVVGTEWIEMIEPWGTNLMFYRRDYDKVGGWERMVPYYRTEPTGWAEDTSLCVALKSLGSAFVSIRQMVLHFSPRERFFADFETPNTFKAFLQEAYGEDYPERIPCRHPGASTEVSGAIAVLRAHARKCLGNANG